MHTKKTAPKTASSALYVADTGAANTVNISAVPTGAIRVRLWFEVSGTLKRGRVGFQGESTAVTMTDTDDKLGHVGYEVVEFWIPSWAKYIALGSSTANCKVFGMWFYD